MSISTRRLTPETITITIPVDRVVAVLYWAIAIFVLFFDVRHQYGPGAMLSFTVVGIFGYASSGNHSQEGANLFAVILAALGALVLAIFQKSSF